MLVALVCGCSKDAPSGEENLVSASFCVSTGEFTRAADDGDGAAGHVNRCILQIWKGEELYKTEIRTAPAGTREFSFKGVTLNPEETYDFLFWADCGTATGGDLYYSTQSLKNVSMLIPEKGNDDAMDAFCNHLSECTIDTEHETRLILRRPLAQLNVVTRDLLQVKSLPLAGDFAPKSVSYSFYGCTAFDVLGDKTVGEPEFISVKDVPVYGEESQGVRTLAMSYLFPQEGESVSAVKIEVTNVNGTTVTSSFDNVPFKANWRTNITGNILTVKGGFSVLLVPMFTDEYSR